MTKVYHVPLGEIAAVRLGTVDPSKYPDEVFDLYSIPAFDSGQPDVIAGRDIGSAKQIVETADTLLSRIVPHIRRAWVVDHDNGRRMIASGEWIVFRSERVHPRYLRHILVGDAFHAQFMQTVAGVGGSLLRARPAQVAKITIPLPPLSEQQRIAAILDKADALRRKRQQALQLTEQFLRSTFLDMFGDPVTNDARLPVREMIELVDRLRPISYGILKPGPDMEGGVPYVRVLDIQDGTVLSRQLRRTTPEIAKEYRRSTIEPGDLLLSIRGHVGRMGFVPQGLSGANITQDTARLAISDPELAAYVYWCVNSVAMQRWMARHVKGVAVQGINLGDVKRIPVPIPRKNQLRKFFLIQSRAGELLLRSKSHSEAADNFFHSLVQRAFRGEV